MFGFKKLVTVATTLAALAVPSLALADDHDRARNDFQRDDYAVAELRAEIARDQVELRRDLREHRWSEARRERREIERKESRLRELLEHRHYDRR